jgi:hypothetical protein
MASEIMEWWKTNSFDIAPDQWATLVKYCSQGATDLVWNELDGENRNRFEKILAELKLCDWGRYGYSKQEASANENRRQGIIWPLSPRRQKKSVSSR